MWEREWQLAEHIECRCFQSYHMQEGHSPRWGFDYVNFVFILMFCVVLNILLMLNERQGHSPRWGFVFFCLNWYILCWSESFSKAIKCKKVTLYLYLYFHFYLYLYLYLYLFARLSNARRSLTQMRVSLALFKRVLYPATVFNFIKYFLLSKYSAISCHMVFLSFYIQMVMIFIFWFHLP